MPEIRPLRIIPYIAVIWTALVFATFSSALAGEWRIEKISGDVRVHGASQKWIRAETGQILKSGDSIWTGVGSRAQLATEDGTVLLKPRSLVKIPSKRLPKRMMVIIQGKGELTAKVRKKKNNHFSVRTPFLAAVVKGTEFTVETDSEGSRVNVTSGVVGVTEKSSGKSKNVRAGQSIASGTFSPSSASNSDGGSSSSTHNGSNANSRNGWDDDENLGNDDDPDPSERGRGGGRSSGRSGDDVRDDDDTGDGDDDGDGDDGDSDDGDGDDDDDDNGGGRCEGNCGDGEGNGGGNGTDNEGNGNGND